MQIIHQPFMASVFGHPLPPQNHGSAPTPDASFACTRHSPLTPSIYHCATHTLRAAVLRFASGINSFDVRRYTPREGNWRDVARDSRGAALMADSRCKS